MGTRTRPQPSGGSRESWLLPGLPPKHLGLPLGRICLQEEGRDGYWSSVYGLLTKPGASGWDGGITEEAESPCSHKGIRGQAAALFTGLWTLIFSDREQLFSALYGARKDASKILIVITDGQKKRDPLDYKDVIPSAEAAGIIRYAIGVGCGDALPLLLPLAAS